MIEEALRYLVRLGQDAKPDVVKVDCEPRHVYYLRRPDGTLEQREAESFDNHTAGDLDTLVARVAKQRGEIWVGGESVVGRYGPGLRSKVMYPIPLSSPLAALGRSAWLYQTDFVRQLRTVFAGCLANGDAVLSVFRKMRFANGTVVSSEVGHGKASLGKEIASEVTGAAAIPETLQFELPVYSDPNLRTIRAYVNCAVDIDPVNARFLLIPLAHDLGDAYRRGQQEILSLVRDCLDLKDTPVYLGTPG